MTLEEILAIIERIGSENPPSVAELETAQTDLARQIRAEAKADKVDLAVLTTLRGALTDINTAHSAALADKAAEDAKIADLLADVPDPDASDVPDEPEADPDDEPEPEADPDDAPEAIKPDLIIEPEKVPVAAAATPPVRTLPMRDAISRVRQRPPVPAPLEARNTSGAEIFVSGVQVDQAPTIYEAAKAFERAVRSPSTGKATLVRFDSLMPEGQTLPGDVNGNSRLLDELVGPESQHVTIEAVAASGGCCSLPTPIRTQNVLSSSARPVRDSLPTVGVTQSGAVTYFPAICLPDTGAALWTCAEDESVDPDNDETWKDCAVVDCPTADTTIVDAVYRCLTIGEFQRRFATEQWTGILKATMALQARIAEARLLARMLATVGDTLAGPATGSVFTNWAQGLQVIVDSIRQDQRYIDVNIHQWIPSWLPGAIASDFYARRLEHIPDPTEVRMLMAGVARNAGVTITETPDLNDMTHATPAYPATATTVIAPEGYYSFLDGGQFDLGIEIRDLDLARQNAVAAFAESFEGLLARGCNAWRNDITITVCDTAAGCAGS